MKDLKYSILINKATNQFAERGFECILAVVLGLGTLTLCMLFPVMGIAIGLVVASFLCIGIKKYLLAVAQDKFIPVESIFSTYKIVVTAFCLKVAYTLISILWGIVFIIPGIVTALNYSMASFLMAEDEGLSSLECMVKSKKLVYGHRTQIFIIYLSYFFVSLVTICLFASLGIAMKTFFNVALWVPIVTMIVASLFVLVVFVVPYFELALTNVYLELKKNYEKQNTAKTEVQPKTTQTKTATKKSTATTKRTTQKSN